MTDYMQEKSREEMHEEMREAISRELRWHYVPRAVKLLIIAVLCFAVMALVGWLLMSLWNWLLPGLFGFKTIGYWQAVGLMFLSRLLFGGFRATGGRGRDWQRDRKWRRRMFKRWEQMTPEDRERFREGMRRRYGPFGPTEAKPGV